MLDITAATEPRLARRRRTYLVSASLLLIFLLASLSWTAWDAERVVVLEDGEKCTALSIDFSPAGDLLACGNDDGTVHVFSLRDGKVARVLEHPAEQVPAVAFSPDGTLLATGAMDGRVRLWPMDLLHPVRVLAGPPEPASEPGKPSFYVDGIAFSPDGAIVAATVDRTYYKDPDNKHGTSSLCLWSTADGRLLRTLEGGWGFGAVFSANGRLVASGGGYTALQHVWRVSTGALVSTSPGDTGWLLGFLPDGSLASLAWVTSDAQVAAVVGFDPLTGGRARTLGATTGCRGAALSASGEEIVGYFDVVARTGQPIPQAPPGASRRVIDPETTELRISSTRDGASLRTFRSPEQLRGGEAVAFSRDGEFVAAGSAGYPGRVYVLHARSLRAWLGRGSR